MKKLTFTLSVAASIFPTTAFAEVDLRNGSFIVQDNSSLPRIYNSRSLHRGLFGFGWCTPFEDAIETANADSIRLRDCESGQLITFKLQRNQLRSPSSAQKVFRSGDETVVSDGVNYTHQSKNRGTKTFDKNGRLLKISDERGKTARIIYDKNGFIKEILSGRMDSFEVKVDPRTGRAVEVIDPRGARTRLTFLNGTLISAATLRNVKFYTYDEVTNLIEVKDQEKTTSVKYTPLDQVARVDVANDCSETYSYIRASATLQQTEVTTNCRGINNKRLIDFHYAKSSDGAVLLNKVSIRTPANKSMEQR